MHHDPQLTIEKFASTPSLLDESTILAEAQRLRAQMFGQWLRRILGNARKSAAHAVHGGNTPTGPLKWHGS